MSDVVFMLGMSLVAKEIWIALLVIVAALVIFIATRPADFRIERSAAINAPGDVIFAMIDDFHQWSLWSPWEKIDPAMNRSFDGPTSGIGAIYAWTGNKKVGAGRMTILDSKPGDFVSIQLEFIKPFAATNRTSFKLTPSDAGTHVTWSMEGRNGFILKAFTVFLNMNMDKMVGKDFERGLANLNTAAQSKTA